MSFQSILKNSNRIIVGVIFVIGTLILSISFPVSSSKIGRANQRNKSQIPIVYKGHLYIQGEIAGIKGNFVFDTGASNLYIDSTFYANNNFEYENTFTAHLPGAGTTPQTVLVIQDSVKLKLAKNLYQTTTVPILQLKPILGDIADGILGMEYFYNSVLEINYEKEYMNLHHSIDSINLNDWSKIRLSKKNNRLFIPLEIVLEDSIKIEGKYQLDFGSGGSVSFTSVVAEKYNLKKNITNKVPYYTKYGGVGGESSSYDFYGSSLQIGDFKFDNVLMDFSLDSAGAMASKVHLGLLGNKIYERFHVVIDFKNSDLYLKPNENYNKSFEASKLGFRYTDRRETLGSWVVSGLYTSSLAELAGLKIDDKIRAINGLSVSNIDTKLQETFFEALNEITLSVRRGDEYFEISFKLNPVL